jgi:Phosphoglycerol transferase and related proteins, alkaline phosphatase superfamily
MKTQRALAFKYSVFLLTRILIVNAIFLLIGFLFRLAFMLFYGESQELKNFTQDLVHAFILGTRFDSTVLFYVNAIPLLVFFLAAVLSFIPVPKNWLQNFFAQAGRWLVPYYLVMLFIVTFITCVDFGFFGFYQDRINLLIFGFFEDDTWALIKTMWKNYPIVWIFTGLFLFLGVLYKGLKKAFPIIRSEGAEKQDSLNYVLFVAFWLAVFFLNGVGARGSLALFPLSEMDTGISKSLFVNHVGYNGVRALGRAIELKSQQRSHWDSNLKYFGYNENYRQAFADYYQIPTDKVPENPLDLLEHQTPENEWAKKNQPHVILLTMESFGAYWLKYNQPGFDLVGSLGKHFQEDTYITHFLSATNATIGSLSSLMIGSPQRPISEFLTESDLLQVPFRTSIARNFKNAGYDARFVYGGNPGWREINKFAFSQGFDAVDGESEIAADMGGLKERHDWGIYDEDVFDYLYKKISTSTKPQFLLAMTTTNHPPYQLPSSWKSPELTPPPELKSRLIGDGNLAAARFKTYRYSSEKLADFIHKIKTSPMKDKVILAVTGDHTFWIINFSEEELLQKGAVPFYIYVPQAIKKSLDKNKFGSQADIPVTLYNLALSNQKTYVMGSDLFAKTPGFAVNSGNLIVSPTGGVMMGRSAADDQSLNWSGDFEKLVPGDSDDAHHALAKKYKSLMGVLDYYFMQEKKTSKGQHADSRR